MVALARVMLALVGLLPYRLLQRAGGSRFPRRAFLRNAVVGAAGLAGLHAAGGALAYAWPLKTSAFGTPITVAPEQVPAVGEPPFRHQAGKFYLINNEEGVLALYWKCPHLGCTVPWLESEGQFKCPCHSSQYNRYGEVTDGPAPRPMDLMAITFDDFGNLVVNTGDIRERSRFEPEQATQI